jgi:structural maintenance of chromosome 1
MPLLRLELDNFKSYEGKQIVGPFSDFTCVIGPNGSGKSNMMDAISFVLGVQSKHLRSSSLKELIFRKDIDTTPAKKASVKLVYCLSEDEMDGYDEGTEISFLRSVSGTGVSSYRFNNKDTTYENYENLLQSIGVLVKTRNFLVFQGDVESVASKSPAELTKLLEQICGTDTLREEYENLLNKKDDAEESTIFSLQKKKMYITQKKEVKEQKDEAELFQLKQDELESLKTEHALWRIWKIKEDMEKHQLLANSFKEDVGSSKSIEIEIDDELLNGKKDLSKANKLVVVCEKELTTKTKQMDSNIVPQLAEIKAKVRSLTKRLKELENSEENMKKDLDEQEENLLGLQNDIALLTEAEEKLIADLESSSSGTGPQMDAQKADEYSRLREDASAQTAVDRAELTIIEQELKSKKLRIERMNTQNESIKTDSNSGDRLIQEYTERASKLRSAISEGIKDKDQTTLEHEKALEDIKTSSLRSNELSLELEEVTNRVKEAGEDKRRGKQVERVAEAIETMKRIFTGVHGKLVDLCKPIQKKYANAIAMTAGKQMDAIVVDKMQVASECIRYLKDQRVGTCIFLPLDNLAPKPPSERLRSLGPKFRLAIDLVECDDIYKNAIAYALGDTLVCDTLEEAQELCFNRGEKVKVVTLNGHVISKNGAMTGGTTSQNGGDRWEEKEVERLRRRKTELEEAFAKNKQSTPTRQHMVDLETKLKTLQTRIQFSEADLKVTEEKLTQLNQQKRLKNDVSKDLKKEMTILRKDIESLENRSTLLTNKIREIESQIFQSFSISVGVENIREYEETKLQLHQDLIKKRNLVTEQRAAVTSQLSYELKRDFAGNIARLQNQRKESNSNLTLLQTKEKAIIEKENQLKAAIKSSSDKLKELNKDRSSSSSLVKELQTKRTLAISNRDSLVKKLSGEEILIERSRSQMHEILQKAQVDEIALPTADIDLSSDDGVRNKDLVWKGTSRNKKSFKRSSSIDIDEESLQESTEEGESETSSSTGSMDTSKGSKSTRATTASTHFSQSDNPTVKRDQKKVSKVDLSSLRKYKNYSKQQLTEVQNTLIKKISALSNDLEDIQPNMHAVERYEGVIDKLKDCTNDLDTAKEAAREVSSRFEDIKKLRQSRFQDCFQHVSEALSIIYKDLTKSTKHPLGGNAYLTLDNTDEPYLSGIRFTAMPPMKRFRDMEQLSGGEKTIAALALLFSIHSYRQAPFFVLDEVDAALDNVNVKKVCNYIQQRSKDFQCIVISLKDMFFEHADSLIGVCKDVNTLSSQILTLDLKKFDKPTQPVASSASHQGNGGKSIVPSPQSSTPSVKDRSSIGSVDSSTSSGSKSLGKRKTYSSTKSSSSSSRVSGSARRESSLKDEVIPEEEEEESEDELDREEEEAEEEEK